MNESRFNQNLTKKTPYVNIKHIYFMCLDILEFCKCKNIFNISFRLLLSEYFFHVHVVPFSPFSKIVRWYSSSLLPDSLTHFPLDSLLSWPFFSSYIILRQHNFNLFTTTFTTCRMEAGDLPICK